MATTPRTVSTVDPAEIAKFSKLSQEWWDPSGKMAPLHKINPLRLTYIRDAAARKFDRNVRSLNCLAGLRVLDIGCGAGLLCEPLTRLGAQLIGVDPSASNIATRVSPRSTVTSTCFLNGVPSGEDGGPALACQRLARLRIAVADDQQDRPWPCCSTAMT